jgi:hypothetical protein
MLKTAGRMAYTPWFISLTWWLQPVDPYCYWYQYPWLSSGRLWQQNIPWKRYSIFCFVLEFS